MVKPLMILPPVIFAGLAALFFFGMHRDDPDALPSARAGQIAPGVALGELPGKATFTHDDLTRGGVKLVNYWASWCAPCRVEHPHLETLAAEGVPIYGINYKDDADKALAFLAELGDPYVALGTDGGRTALDWGLYGVPETYVLDAEGRVVLRFAGPITASILENTIRPALAQAAGGS
jgi:cytochrome c biogenesis protein CcmG, thiol:disulfide interchange protein DsbE